MDSGLNFEGLLSTLRAPSINKWMINERNNITEYLKVAGCPRFAIDSFLMRRQE